MSKDRFLAGPNGRLHPRPTDYSDTTHRKVRNSVLLGPLNSEQLYAYRRSDMSRRPEKDIGMARSRAKARLNFSAQGQRSGEVTSIGV